MAPRRTLVPLALLSVLLLSDSRPSSAEAVGCAVGKQVCESGCVDLDSDPGNCGRCGKSCLPGACVGGACTEICPGGLAACGASCADLASHRGHCGACGVACVAGEACVAGACLVFQEPP